MSLSKNAAFRGSEELAIAMLESLEGATTFALNQALKPVVAAKKSIHQAEMRKTRRWVAKMGGTGEHKKIYSVRSPIDGIPRYKHLKAMTKEELAIVKEQELRRAERAMEKVEVIKKRIHEIEFYERTETFPGWRESFVPAAGKVAEGNAIQPSV